MSAFYDLSKTPRNILNKAIVRAIVSENNGALFDPSDLSTLYQDAAGTTPVTAVEQPVGKMLDKSGNGYHATQSITASRPTLSARKNILLASETLATQSVTTLAATYTISFTGTGSVALSGAATGTLTGNGTGMVSLTFTPTAGTLTLTVSGGVTKAQLELGAVVGQYQRVTTSTDYDTDKRYFPKYLRFDGVDDYMSLGDVFDVGADGVSMIAAVTVNGGAKYPITGKSLASADPGRYFLGANSASFAYAGEGSMESSIAYTPVIGATKVYNMTLSAGSSHRMSLRANGTLIDDVPTSFPEASNTSLDFMIGRYPASYGYLNGRNYGLIVTAKALSVGQAEICERYLSRKSGVQL